MNNVTIGNLGDANLRLKSESEAALDAEIKTRTHCNYAIAFCVDTLKKIALK